MAKTNAKREKSKETVEDEVESNESVVSGGATVNFNVDKKEFNTAVFKFNDQVNGITNSLKKAIDEYENKDATLESIKAAIYDALTNLGAAEEGQESLKNAIAAAAAATDPLNKDKLHDYLSAVYAAYKAKYDVAVAKYDILKKGNL